MLSKRKGRIINITSTSGQMGQAGQVNYSASKAGLIGATMALAREIASRGITVNAVAPGFFLTQQNRFLLMDEKTGNLTARGKKIITNTPMGRFGEVDELQGTVLYLLSDLSKFITGIVIPVDGGYSAFGGV